MSGSGARVAIVGAGLMGRWHAHFAARAGATVVAVVDRDLAAARGLAARHSGARPFDDLAECLDAVSGEIAHICTPPESHAPLVTAALEHGRHVLAEKPLAPGGAEVAALLDLAARRGLLLGATHQFPYQRGVRRVARDRARLGELVRLAYATSTAGGDGLPPPARRELLLAIVPHPLSLFRALLGVEIAAIDWDLLALRDEDLELRGRAGGTVVHAAIDLRGRPTRNEVLVVGERGTARADLYHGYALFEGGEVSRAAKALRPFGLGARLVAAAGGNLALRAARREPAYPGLGELIARFYRAVASGGPCPVAPREIADIAAVVERLRVGAR